MPLLEPLDIINAACARFGEDALQSLDDDVGDDQPVGLLYQNVVDFNLGIYQFSWAKEIFQLSVNDTAAAMTGYSVVFDLPPERIGQPLYVTDDITDPDRRFSRYVLKGDQVHSDANPLFAMCRFRPAPSRWEPVFKSATITALASQLALAMAHDRQTAEGLHAEAYGTPSQSFRGGQMGKAIDVDAHATPPRRANFDNNPLTNARRGGW